METRYLRTLIAAVEQGSFSKAAEILHITQSAVSQRIKFLEDQFEQQLLDRSGSKLVLTSAGQVVLAKAREILDKENELINCLKEDEAKKRLALCCTPTFGMAFLPRVLNDFFRSHSDMNDLKFIFMQPLEALRGLRNEEYDLAVVEHCLDQDFSGVKRFSLPDDEMLFVVSSSNELGIKGRERVTDLATLFPLRLFARRDGCSSKEILRYNLNAVGAGFDRFAGVVISDDLRYTIQAVLEGTGVAYLSRALVTDYLKAGRMIGLRADGFDHRRGRSILLQGGREVDPLLNDLLECIFQIVSPFWRPQMISADSPSVKIFN